MMEYNQRSFWNKFKINDDSDQAVLFKHFYKLHFNFLNDKPDIIECFMVIFVKQPDKTLLDYYENE